VNLPADRAGTSTEQPELWGYQRWVPKKPGMELDALGEQEHLAACAPAAKPRGVPSLLESYFLLYLLFGFGFWLWFFFFIFHYFTQVGVRLSPE